MQCVAYATAEQYHLPTLCHDLIANGFFEIMDLPRGWLKCCITCFFCFPLDVKLV